MYPTGISSGGKYNAGYLDNIGYTYNKGPMGMSAQSSNQALVLSRVQLHSYIIIPFVKMDLALLVCKD